MPPLPNVPNVVKIEAIFQHTSYAKEVANIFHVSYTGASPLTAGQLVTFSAAMDPLLDNLLTTFMYEAWTHTETRYTDLTSDVGGAYTSNPNTAATAGGTEASIQVAACISWSISRRYRGGHPRTYLGGLETAQTVPPNSLSTAFRTNLANAANTFNTAVEDLTTLSSTWHLVNVSYYTGDARRVTPVVDQINGASVHPRLCSQRRRLGKEST